MNVQKLPLTAISSILHFLELKDLVKLSGVNKFFNKFCHDQRLNFFSKFLELSSDRITIDMFPEAFVPTLSMTNFLKPAVAWKNVVFYLMLNSDSEFCQEILSNFIPNNVMVSAVGLTSLEIENLHPSLKLLDCPWRIMNCPKEISHNLEYLNMSEQFYIPKHIDFSGKNLRVLHMNMCRLNNLTFNFSKTLKIVSIFGCTGITSLIGFEYVEKLKMDYCDKIESISPLKNVIELSMRHCDQIKNVSYIKKCEILDISYTNVKDVSMLKNLKKVKLSGLEKITFNVLRKDILYLS